MQNVVAINSAARQSIVAAQATSARCPGQYRGWQRTAMHILYSRHNVRVLPFILRIVRDTTMAEDWCQVFLDVWRTGASSRPLAGVHLAFVDRPLQALTRCVSGAFEDIDRKTRERTRRQENLSGTRHHQRDPARLRSKMSPATVDHQPRLLSREVSERSADLGIPQSTVKTRMFYARKQLAELLRGAGIDSLAAEKINRFNMWPGIRSAAYQIETTRTMKQSAKWAEKLDCYKRSISGSRTADQQRERLRRHRYPQGLRHQLTRAF